MEKVLFWIYISFPVFAFVWILSLVYALSPWPNIFRTWWEYRKAKKFWLDGCVKETHGWNDMKVHPYIRMKEAEKAYKEALDERV